MRIVDSATAAHITILILKNLNYHYFQIQNHFRNASHIEPRKISWPIYKLRYCYTHFSNNISRHIQPILMVREKFVVNRANFNINHCASCTIKFHHRMGQSANSVFSFLLRECRYISLHVPNNIIALELQHFSSEKMFRPNQKQQFCRIYLPNSL
jgi:hypothetical protein